MAYNTSPKQIPFLRHKVAAIMQHSQLSPRSHASKVLMNILETLPRDDLIQASEEELLEISMGIYYMQERRRIRLFARQDIYHRFISCLVYVPKSKFNTILRRQMQAVLKESFQAEEISFSTYYSESILVRIHYLVRVNPERQVEYDYKQIEQKLTQVARQWSDDFQELLQESYGEDLATKLFNRYKKTFAVDYTAIASPGPAVAWKLPVAVVPEKTTLYGVVVVRPVPPLETGIVPVNAVLVEIFTKSEPLHAATHFSPETIVMPEVGPVTPRRTIEPVPALITT
jgi:glutamate dehydrogenase